MLVCTLDQLQCCHVVALLSIQLVTLFCCVYRPCLCHFHLPALFKLNHESNLVVLLVLLDTCGNTTGSLLFYYLFHTHESWPIMVVVAWHCIGIIIIKDNYTQNQACIQPSTVGTTVTPCMMVSVWLIPKCTCNALNSSLIFKTFLEAIHLWLSLLVKYSALSCLYMCFFIFHFFND